MYDPREILKRSPADIANAVIVLLNLLVLTNAVNFGDEAKTNSVLAGINIATVTLLTLFYVKPSTISRKSLETLQDAVDEAFVSSPVTAKKISGKKRVAKKA